MSPAFQVLHIDDDDDYVGYVIEFFETVKIASEKCEVTGTKSFETGMAELVDHHYDLLVLDVFKGNPSENHTQGLETFNEIRKKRFVPTVFLTARATDVLGMESPVLKVVWKTGDWQSALQKSIEDLEKAGVFRLMRAVHNRVDEVTRDFMWKFFPEAANFELLRKEPGIAAILLARSIGFSLEGPGAAEVARAVTGTEPTETRGEVHPALMYVPALTDPEGVRAGDVRKLDARWYLVLTPSCDLVKRANTRAPGPKAKLVLCARCLPQAEFQPTAALRSGGMLPDGRRASQPMVLRMLRGRGEGEYRDDQLFFLPKAFGCPGLVADLEDLVAFPYRQVEESLLVVRLDSPYVEGLTNRFTRFVGRVGMPDVDFAGSLR